MPPPVSPSSVPRASSRLAVLGLVAVALAGGVLVGVTAAGFTDTAGGPWGVPTPIAAESGPSALPSAAPVPSPTATARPTPTPSPTPVPTPVLVAAPLTGRLVTPEVAQRHPIAVMIDDHPAARPQSGLGDADVVWHAPAEGGIPRYMAMFQDTVPGLVGPVRSARQYYIAWAAEWRASYVHSGGSPQALRTLRTQGRGELVYDADEFRWGNRYLWRDTARFAPHNVYTDGEHLRKLARKIGAEDGPLEAAWVFGPDRAPEGRPVGGTIEVAYAANRIRYAYDRRTNTYPRTVSGEGAQVDAADGDRVAPKNVVVMLVRFGPLDDGNPAKLRLEADVIGSGRAWIATGGETIRGTWTKTSMTAPTRFLDADGRPVTLTVGQTFVQVLPTGTKVRITAGRPVTIPRHGPAGA